MASTSGDNLSYFKKGAVVEISSDDEGFRGSWYEGTIVKAPANIKRVTTKVLVEYKTLMEDEAGTTPLREEVQVVQLRPPPPRESSRSFKNSEEVDAYHSDGWWEGIITAVMAGEGEEEDRYAVFFRGTREQLEFKGSELRLHREWVHGDWVPPLEVEDVPTNDEKVQSSAKVEANQEVAENIFSPGTHVEVSSDEEGFQGAWFAATVVEELKEGSYLIEYQSLRNDDDTGFLREEVDSLHIRPCPPEIHMANRYQVLDDVDALHNDGWWVGMVSKVLRSDRYSVYFKNTREEIKFKHSDLRPHQEWLNGEWVMASKV